MFFIVFVALPPPDADFLLNLLWYRMKISIQVKKISNFSPLDGGAKTIIIKLSIDRTSAVMLKLYILV